VLSAEPVRYNEGMGWNYNLLSFTVIAREQKSGE
jgi:hypothetical protein